MKKLKEAVGISEDLGRILNETSVPVPECLFIDLNEGQVFFSHPEFADAHLQAEIKESYEELLKVKNHVLLAVL